MVAHDRYSYQIVVDSVQVVPEIAKDPTTKVYAVVRSAQWLLPS